MPAPTYLVHFPNGAIIPCGVDVWLMRTSDEATRAIALMDIDCLSEVDPSAGETILYGEVLDEDKLYLVMIWTAVTPRELVDVARAIVQNYNGTPCAWDDTKTVEIADCSVGKTEEDLRVSSLHASMN